MNGYEYTVVYCGTNEAIDITNIEVKAGEEYMCENSLASLSTYMVKRGWALHTVQVLFNGDGAMLTVWERPIDDIEQWRQKHA